MQPPSSESNETSVEERPPCVYQPGTLGEYLYSLRIDEQWLLAHLPMDLVESIGEQHTPTASESDHGPDGTRRKRKKPMCSACDRKLMWTDMPCRCGHIYCPRHRHAEDHSCTYDYKGNEKLRLKVLHPCVRPKKLVRI